MRFLLFLQSSPDKAVLLAVAGILLIFLELNRPGLIVPGASGLIALLLALATLLRLHVELRGIALLLIAFAVQASSLRRPFSWLSATMVGAGILFGCLYLMPGDVSQIHLPAALTAALVLGPGTSMLTAIARRARRNKGLDS